MSVEGPLLALQPGECDHVRVRATEDGTPYGTRRCLDCGAVLPPGPPKPPRWRQGDGTVTMAPPDPQRLVQENAQLRQALAKIRNGVWTASNSIETIVWLAGRALDGHEVK